MIVPALSTEQLLLRPIEDRDTANLFRLFSDDRVTRFMDIESFAHIGDATQIITHFRERQAAGDGMRLAVTFAGQDELIGTCGYHRLSKTHYRAEIGYDLLPEYWGRGIMTTAVGRLLGYGFEQLQLNRIEAFVDPQNAASARLLRKLGFSLEGLLRDAFHEKGQFVDAEIYSLLRREYSAEPSWI